MVMLFGSQDHTKATCFKARLMCTTDALWTSSYKDRQTCLKKWWTYTACAVQRENKTNNQTVTENDRTQLDSFSKPTYHKRLLHWVPQVQPPQKTRRRLWLLKCTIFLSKEHHHPLPPKKIASHVLPSPWLPPLVSLLSKVLSVALDVDYITRVSVFGIDRLILQLTELLGEGSKEGKSYEQQRKL